jgi:antitoxin component of RelBE/YafQ-DinJ toxin-antitoxin module
MKRMNFTIPDRIEVVLRKIAAEKEITLSEIVRRAVEEYAEKEAKK